MSRIEVRSLYNSLVEQRGTVVIVGLGITGVETARFFFESGVNPICIEKQSEEAFKAKGKFIAEVEQLRASGIEVHFGIDGERIESVLSGVGLVVLSPGVPTESAIVGSINRRKIPWISELELGVELFAGKSIIITGSNGKSTTTSLVFEMLKRAGIDAKLCGNIGIPVVTYLKEQATRESVLVVEASSYQLEGCNILKPAVALVLNISDNHLERHGSLERYAAAKERVLLNQNSADLAIFNQDDGMVLKMVSKSKARHAFFGTKDCSNQYFATIGVNTSTVSLTGVASEGNGGKVVEEYYLQKSRLIGVHNRYNIAAALLAARHFNVSKEQCQEVIDNFTPLEHRIELISERQGRIIINDSKSTTVAAAKAAVEAVSEHFSGKSITLMLGGLSKAGSWAPLFETLDKIRNRCARIICFGKDANILSHQCERYNFPFLLAANVKDGLAAALENTEEMGIILFSPGCASFDEFSDFEERGRYFKSLV